MPGLLDGRTALITGAGTGIGKGIALAFAREGAAVALAGRRKDVIEAAAASLRAGGAHAVAVAGDVSRKEDARRMVEETVQAFGSLHVLVNNAGIAAFGSVEQTKDETVDATVDINLKGPIWLSRAALPHLRQHKESGGAAILNISSGVALIGVRNFAVYSATKAALNHLTKCLALDCGADRIRVNCICPGVVETPIFEKMMPKAAVKKALTDFAKQHPLGRVGQPEDIAAAAVFLCGPQASWITGAILVVDGGLSLGH